MTRDIALALVTGSGSLPEKHVDPAVASLIHSRCVAELSLKLGVEGPAVYACLFCGLSTILVAIIQPTGNGAAWTMLPNIG
jgi:hypothetical protein